MTAPVKKKNTKELLDKHPLLRTLSHREFGQPFKTFKITHNPVQTETLSILNEANHYNNWIMDLVQPYLKGHVLEVGCGTGNFSQKILDTNAVSALTTVDVVSQYTETTLQRTNTPEGKTLSVETLDIFDEENTTLSHQRFDTIVLLNVLEHIENDEQAVERLNQYLNPGGQLIVLVPAQPLLMSAYDKAIGHFRRYTQVSLSDLFKKSGQWPITESRNFNVLGIAGWIWNFKIRQKQVFNNAHVGLFNRLVPMLQWLESKVSPMVGLSVFLVAEKPA